MPDKRILVSTTATLIIVAYAVLYASPYGLRVLTVAGVYALAAIGFQIVFGLGGALSLAHGAFFGLGAYTAGILAIRLGWEFPATFSAALAVPAMTALAVGLPVLRLESHYFSLATLGIAQVALLLAVNLPDLSGGANGLPGVPGIVVAGQTLPRGLPLAAAVWVVVGIGGLAAARLAAGRWGRALALVRDDPLAAEAVGLDIGRLRLGAFLLSSIYAGAAGALTVHIQRVVSPEVLEFPVMVTILAITVVGGRGRVAGAVLGSLLLIHLPEWFRFFERSYLLLYGGALLATIVFVPDGVIGLVGRFLPARRHPLPAPAPLPPPARSKIADALSVERLAKAFGGVRAVDDVSFSLKRGEIIGVVGANGSGKTTLINLISGLEQPDRGRIRLLGRDATGDRPDRRARLGLARSFQTPALPEQATALDAVAAGRLADAPCLNAAEANALYHLSTLEISGLARQKCGDLPAASRRKVEIARALAGSPAVLLLDEPAAGMTDKEKDGLSVHLRSIAGGGVAILLIEHDLRFLMTLADRLVVLDRGRVLCDGRPAEVMQDDAVIAAYLGRAS